jgi:hypothetical protein
MITAETPISRPRWFCMPPPHIICCARENASRLSLVFGTSRGYKQGYSTIPRTPCEKNFTYDYQRRPFPEANSLNFLRLTASKEKETHLDQDVCDLIIHGQEDRNETEESFMWKTMLTTEDNGSKVTLYILYTFYVYLLIYSVYILCLRTYTLCIHFIHTYIYIKRMWFRLGTHERLNDVRCDGRLFVRTYL